MVPSDGLSEDRVLIDESVSGDDPSADTAVVQNETVATVCVDKAFIAKASVSVVLPLMSRADMGADDFPACRYDTSSKDRTKELTHRGWVSVKVLGADLNDQQFARISGIIDEYWGILSEPTGRIGKTVGLEYKVLYDHGASPSGQYGTR